MNKKKTSEKKSRRKKIFLISGISLFGILFGLFILLYFYAENIIKTAIVEAVHIESSDIYSISFQDIDLNLGKQTLEFQNVYLKPDTILYHKLLKQHKINSPLYDIKLSSFIIKNIGFFNFLFNKKLLINEIEFNEPSINIIELSNSVKKHKNIHASLQSDLIPLITSYLELLSIKNIRFNNGSFDFYKNIGDTNVLSTIKNISLNISDFTVDKNDSINKNRTFFSNDIEIEFSDLELNLSDSIHLLKAEKIIFSTLKSELLAKNLTIKPKTSNDSSHNYNISIPLVSLSSVDFEKILESKEIQIGKIEIAKPEIDYYLKKHKQNETNGDKSFTKLDLFPLLKGKFKSAEIDTFSITNGNIEIYKSPVFNEANISSKDFSIELYDFRLDSNSINNDKKILYADDIELLFNDYSLQLKNNHVLKAKEIKVSTLLSEIIAIDIEIVPENNSKANDEKEINYDLNLNFSEIKFSGADLIQAYNCKHLPVNQLLIEKPNIFIKTHSKKTQKNTKPKKQHLHHFLKNFNLSLEIDQISFNSGFVKFDKIAKKGGFIFSGEFSMFLENFIADASKPPEPHRMLYADDFEFDIENFKIELIDKNKLIDIKSVGISTKNSTLSIKNLGLHDFKTNQDENSINLTINELGFAGVNFKEAYINNNLYINKIDLEQPNFIFNKNSSSKKVKKINTEQTKATDQLFNVFKLIEVEEFSIDDGTAKIMEKENEIFCSNNISLQGRNFFIDEESYSKKEKTLFSDFFEIQFKENKFSLPKLNHKLFISDFGYSTINSSIFFKNISIIPLLSQTKVSQNKPLIYLNSSNIEFADVDVNKIIFDKKIDIGNLKLENPDCKIILANKQNIKKDKIPEKQKNDGKSFYFDHIEIDKILFSNIDFKLGRETINEEDIFATFKIDFSLNNLYFDEENLNSDEKFYPFDDFDMNLRDIKFYLQDSLHIVNANKINVSTKNSEIYIKGFRISPNKEESKVFLRKSKKSAIFDAYIPDFEIKGIDFKKLFTNRELQIVSATLKQPQIDIINFTDTSKVNKSPKTKFDLTDKLPSILKSFSLKEFDVNNLSLKYANRKASGLNDLLSGKISVKIRDIVFDTSKIKDNFLQTKDIDLTVRDYKYITADSMYTLKAGEIGLSTLSSRIFVNSFSFKPNYPKYEFSRKLGYQTDRADIVGKKIIIEGIDFNKILQHKQLYVNHAVVDSFEIELFRDKRVAFPEWQRRSLLQTMLRKIKIPFKIDSVNIKNTHFVYVERVKKAFEPGEVFLESLNAKMTGFTNDSILVSQGAIGKVETNFLLMGKGFFKGELNFPLVSEVDTFNFSGSLTKIELKDFNPMSENVFGVKITEGEGKIDIPKINANNDYSTGEILFPYENFRIKIIDKKTGKKGGLGDGIATFLANEFILKHKNPSRKNKLRHGMVYFERDKRKSLFNFIWKSILSGIESSLGFNTKKQREERRAERKNNKN
ncbi:MAG: hypothetical protein JEY97_08790 [Bacteroidales bacterium]|nr:hypothetical protein [Bacteroidales bacterium]